MNTPIYYAGTVLTESDYPSISEEFRIPIAAVEGAVEQIRKKGEPSYSLFPAAIREQVRQFASRVFLDLSETEAIEEPDEPCLVVDGLSEPAVATAPPFVAHSEGDAPKDAPAPQGASKKTKPVEKAFSVVEDEDTSPAQLAEVDEVVNGATTALIQAMTMGEGHFIITPEGHCTINPASPPTLVHAYQVVESSLKLDQLGEKVTDAAAWLQGDLIMELEDYFQEQFSISQVCDINTASYNTLATRLGVCREFRGKRYKLSFTHHKEAHYAKIPDETKKLILHKAETYGLSSKHVRSLASVYKTMNDDQTIRNIRSNQQALDLIAAYKQAKTTYAVFTEGAWIRIVGLGDVLPMASETEHFPVMLDLKNWKSYANGKEMGDIPKRGTRS